MNLSKWIRSVKINKHINKTSEFTYNNWYGVPVAEQYVGAFDISMKEVVLMAVVQTLHQLAHEAANVLMGELDQA